MKVIIRVQSPQLKRLLFPARRIERLPRFNADAKSRAGALTSPFAVWVSSIVTVLLFLSLAMVASFESTGFTKLSDVGQGLVRNVTANADAGVDAARPPEASFPYGSVPPRQSIVSPTTRPALTPMHLAR